MTVIKFGGAFIILVAIDWRLTVFLFALLPVMAVISIVNDRRMEQALLRSKSDRAEMNSHLEDVLSGIRTVKAFGAERDEARRFHSFNDRYTGSQCRYYKIEAIFYEVMGSFPQILTMLTICAGGVLIGLGRMGYSGFGDFFAVCRDTGRTDSEQCSTLCVCMKRESRGLSGIWRCWRSRLRLRSRGRHPICRQSNCLGCGVKSALRMSASTTRMRRKMCWNTFPLPLPVGNQWHSLARPALARRPSACWLRGFMM